MAMPRSTSFIYLALLATAASSGSFEERDLDGNGSIDYHEFAFYNMDSNHDGVIDSDEWEEQAHPDVLVGLDDGAQVASLLPRASRSFSFEHKANLTCVCLHVGLARGWDEGEPRAHLPTLPNHSDAIETESESLRQGQDRGHSGKA